MRQVSVLLVALVSMACAGEPVSTEPAVAEPAIAAEREEVVHLGVPPGLMTRAREEAAGLGRLPESLRRRALERGRERGSPPYESLRTSTSAHEGARVTYEGRVSLARSAGTGLWILALQTRADAERWRDPLYVLSVVPPGLPPEGGARARIDGWVVGARTIGRNTLPLVLAFQLERLD